MKYSELHFLAAFGLLFLATTLAIVSATWIVEREAERKAIKSAQAAQAAAQAAGK